MRILFYRNSDPGQTFQQSLVRVRLRLRMIKNSEIVL